MQKQTKGLTVEKSLTKIFAIVMVLLMVFSMIWQNPWAMAETPTVISIDPPSAFLKRGDNLTITANVANIPELFAWQVALKYNGTVFNCTEAWIPDDNVFSGKTQFPPEAVFGVDTHDGLSYLYIGNSLLVAPVVVTSGVLFKANFTAVEDGTTTLLMATTSSPVYFSITMWDLYYTALVDYDAQELPFTATSCSVTSGDVQAKPVAAFSIFSPVPDNSTHYVLNGHPPSSGIIYQQSYVGYVNVFNASASHTPDPNRTIARYLWDFGDGNITETTSPIVTHVYTATGAPKTVILKVTDSGNPSETSDIASRTVVLGMVLEYFNWMPLIYVVLAIIAILVVWSVAKGVIKRRARPRERTSLGEASA